MEKYCVIVKRGDLDLYDLLYHAFAHKAPVILERRRGDRRKAASVDRTSERRQRERRGPPPASWKALGFVVVERTAFLKPRSDVACR